MHWSNIFTPQRPMCLARGPDSATVPRGLARSCCCFQVCDNSLFHLFRSALLFYRLNLPSILTRGSGEPPRTRFSETSELKQQKSNQTKGCAHCQVYSLAGTGHSQDERRLEVLLCLRRCVEQRMASRLIPTSAGPFRHQGDSVDLSPSSRDCAELIFHPGNMTLLVKYTAFSLSMFHCHRRVVFCFAYFKVKGVLKKIFSFINILTQGPPHPIRSGSLRIQSLRKMGFLCTVSTPQSQNGCLCSARGLSVVPSGSQNAR